MFRTSLGKKIIFATTVSSAAALVTGSTLYAFELNKLVNDAQLKISNLSNQILKQEKSEFEKLDQFLSYQKKSDETIAKLTKEISYSRNDLEMAYLKKVNLEGAIRDVLEEDFKRYLKLLISAHNENLNEELQAQSIQLKKSFEELLNEKLAEQKKNYYKDLNTSIYKLHEIEKILQVRKKLDEEELKARLLWSMCQMLKNLLKNAYSITEPELIKNYLEYINNLVKEFTDNQLLQIISKSINEKKNNFIYTEDKLIERFKKINKLCRRVALVKDNDTSLVKYLLSYIQSILIIDNFIIDPEEVAGNKIVDINKWNTFSILARINYCLKERNLEKCLKYANLLKGAPEKIANEWINDLKTHLELKQAANILEAQAAIYTVRSLN